MPGGYFVSIGTIQLFFAWLYGPSFPGLDWKVPIFLFVILIAASSGAISVMETTPQPATSAANYIANIAI